jgi:tetratricopeptide (TPR) repeat protein
MGTQPQIHDYARGLEAQGHYDEALELFRANIKKDPNSWIGHNEAARIAVEGGDYDTAIKEMKLAIPAAPGQYEAAGGCACCAAAEQSGYQ